MILANWKMAQQTFRVMQSHWDVIEILFHDGAMTVTELFCAMRVSQPEMSYKLGELRKHGLVKRERRGKYQVYELNQEYLDWLDTISESIATKKWMACI